MPEQPTTPARGFLRFHVRGQQYDLRMWEVPHGIQRRCEELYGLTRREIAHELDRGSVVGVHAAIWTAVQQAGEQITQESLDELTDDDVRMELVEDPPQPAPAGTPPPDVSDSQAAPEPTTSGAPPPTSDPQPSAPGTSPISASTST